MTQPYDERPVAPTSTPHGVDEDAPVQPPDEATPPQDAGETEPLTSEAPAEDTAGPDAAAPDASVAETAGPGGADPGDAESGGAEPDAGAADAGAAHDPAVQAPTDDPAASTDHEGFGDPRVDDAVARLQDLAERPVGEHAEILDDIHQRLRDALEEAAVEPAEDPRG